MPRILIAGKLHDSGLDLIERAKGFVCDYVPDPDPGAYLARLPEAEGLVLRTQPLSSEHVAKAAALRVVSRHGVGYDAVDVAALDARSIPLAIVGDVNSGAVAEHAMMLMLAASRRLAKSAAAVNGGDWAYRDRLESRELRGKTLLVIGYGRIGRRVAGLARAFGMRVLAHDPYLPPGGFEGAEPAPDLDAALAACDVVSIHAPRSERPAIGPAEIAALRHGAVIVNTARGGAVDEDALADALRSGAVGSAGLDVLADEPPEPGNPLLRLENCVVTPHSAGLTRECAERMAVSAVRNVLDFFDGTLDPALVVNLRQTAAAQ